MTLNSWSPCFHLLNAGVTGMPHHAQFGVQGTELGAFPCVHLALFRSLKMGGRPLWKGTVAVFRWCVGIIVFLVTENSICIKAVRMTDVCPSSDFISYHMKATVLLHTILGACECAEVPYCRGSPKHRFTCKQLSLTNKNLNATTIPLSNLFRSAVPCGDALPVYVCLEYCCLNSCKGAGRHTLRF